MMLEKINKNSAKVMFYTLLGLSLVLVNVIWKFKKASIPFWYDEVWRANIVSCFDFPACVHVWSGTPINMGWAYITRFFIEIFGNNELVIRLLPLLASLLTPLIVGLIGYQLGNIATALFLSLFFTITPLFGPEILELKPYAVDVFIALSFLYLLILAEKKTIYFKTWSICALLIGATFLENTAVLLFPGVLLALIWIDYRDNKKLLSSFKKLVPAGFIVFTYVLCYYFFFLKKQADSDIYVYWRDTFPKTLGFSDLVSYISNNTRNIFQSGIFPDVKKNFSTFAPFAWVFSAAYFLVGGVAAYRKHEMKIIVLFPLFVMATLLTFSFLGVWPYGFVRLNKFYFALLAVPSYFGFLEVIRLGLSRIYYSPLVLVSLSWIAITFPDVQMTSWFKSDERYERIWAEFKPVVKELKEKMQENDVVVVYHFMGVRNFQYHFSHYDWGEDLSAKNVHVYYDDYDKSKAFVLHEDFYKNLNIPPGNSLFAVRVWEAGTELKENLSNWLPLYVGPKQNYFGGYHIDVDKYTHIAPGS